MRAMLTLSANDRPRFHSDMPVSELAERDTRAIEESVVSLAPLVAETMDGMMHEICPTPTETNKARGLKPPDPSSGIQLTRVRRPAHEELKATSRRTEPGEKTQMSPNGLFRTRLKEERVISTMSFDPIL